MARSTSSVAESDAHLLQTSHEILERVKAMEKRFDQLERLVGKCSRELKAMIEDQEKQTFTLKNSQYEV